MSRRRIAPGPRFSHAGAIGYTHSRHRHFPLPAFPFAGISRHRRPPSEVPTTDYSHRRRAGAARGPGARFSCRATAMRSDPWGRYWFPAPESFGPADSAVKRARLSASLGPASPNPARGPIRGFGTCRTVARSIDVTLADVIPGIAAAAAGPRAALPTRRQHLKFLSCRMRKLDCAKRAGDPGSIAVWRNVAATAGRRTGRPPRVGAPAEDCPRCR